jgi:hypothetical protein
MIFTKAVVPVIADDDMVCEPEPEKPGTLYKLLRDIEILLARRRIAARMVVQHDDHQGIAKNRLPKKLRRRDERLVITALRNQTIAQETALCVKKSAHKMFLSLVPKLLHIVLRDGGRTSQGKLIAPPGPRDPSRKLRNSLELDRLYLTDPTHLQKLFVG